MIVLADITLQYILGIFAGQIAWNIAVPVLFVLMCFVLCRGGVRFLERRERT